MDGVTLSTAQAEGSDASTQAPPATDHSRGGAAHAVRRLPVTRLIALVMLLAGFWRGWLQPSFGPAERATAFDVIIPGTHSHQPVSWGLLVLCACALLAAGFLFEPLRWLSHRIAALTALIATVGFVISCCFVDKSLQERLSRSTADGAALQRLVGFQIPRPHLTSLGPIPLPDNASLVFSGLRLGFYLSLVGAVTLMASVLGERHVMRSASRAGRLTLAAVAVVLVGAVIAGLAQSVVAVKQTDNAAASAARGDDQTAAAKFKDALSLNGGLASSPDFASQYGLSLLRTGHANRPEAALAQSRLQLGAGLDDQALRTVASAASRYPADPALRYEFSSQALYYLTKHAAPHNVQALVTSRTDSAVLRLSLAKSELGLGDVQAAEADARVAERLATDEEVRSVALTYLSVAQTRGGDPVTGRRTLLTAVKADKQFVNVIARSLLTGLYITLPQ